MIWILWTDMEIMIVNIMKWLSECGLGLRAEQT